jgi:RNA polymerase sigma-70 factor, ECF subfamily
MAAVSPLSRASGVEPRNAPADALTGLYERHASRVFQYCLNWLRSREEAEDAAQTTFLYAYRGLDRGVVPAHERPWLLSIARNVCLSRTDAARRRAVEVAQDPHALEETVAAPAPSNDLDGLTDALATLTEQQRHAILLREWHGLTYSEIAERLELSQAAVETLLFRARRSLARRLRQPLGIGSFLPWLRSLAGGGAAKVAIGVAAVAVTATTGAIAVTQQHRLPQHQPRRTTQTPAARGASTHSVAAVRRQAARKVVVATQHGAALQGPPTQAATPHIDEPPQQPTPPRADGAVGPTPAAAPSAIEPATAGAQTITTSATTTTADAVATVVDTVTPVTTVVASTASTAVATVANTATAAVPNTVTTAQAVVDAVTSVVPKLIGPPLP